MEITSEIKLNAIYILILMFNHTILFEFQNKDDRESFLAPFHLKFYELSPRARLVDELESEGIKKERRHFQTIHQSSDGSITVFTNEYVSRNGGGTTIKYDCQIRGMTKQSVLLSRTDKPFRYLTFSPAQINATFDLLCKDQLLQQMRHS